MIRLGRHIKRIDSKIAFLARLMRLDIFFETAKRKKPCTCFKFKQEIQQWSDYLYPRRGTVVMLQGKLVHKSL